MYPLKYNHSHSWRKIKKGVSYECSYGKMSGNINSGILFGAIVTGAFSWLICYQSKIDLLSLVPNTFMGGFSAFASGGDWKMLCICLVLGNILGVCCDYSGRFLAAKFGKDN